MRLRMFGLALMGLIAMLSAPAGAQTAAAGASDGQRACPAGLDAVATCYGGRDANGAFYLIAMPRQWNRMLVVHAHGGPRLGQPRAEDPDEDLERFAVMVRDGYAWIGSTYRRGGYGVRMAAEDVENSRALFWQRFGRPRLTILHGQSYGGNVAAKLAELRAIDGAGERLYDGVLLTNGVLWGGTRAYGFRAELRAVYQYYCRNHPRPEEEQYPLWQGLTRDGRMSDDDLAARVNHCTGLDLPAARRSLEQQRRLTNIVNVTGIAEGNLLRHLDWATMTMRDMVQRRLDGISPFDNSRVQYRGSDDDAALNHGIARFTADPRALTRLAYDSDMTGQIAVPTIALHWRNDPVVSAAADAAYQQLVEARGNGGLFLRLSTADGTHSRLSDVEYSAALMALVDWINTGQRPDTAAIITSCRERARTSMTRCSMQAGDAD
jgi:hypothetical protein